VFISFPSLAKAARVGGGGGGPTSWNAAEGADVNAADDADAKDGAVALQDSGCHVTEGSSRRGGATVVPQNMSLLSTSMEEVVELKAHLQHTHTMARDA